MNQKCFNPKCDNPVVSIKGKRPRKYCSTRCTSAHWQALHYKPKKEFVKIPIEAYREMQLALIKRDTKTDLSKSWDATELMKAAVTDFKPQEPAKTKKEGKATQKEDKAPVELENASGVDKAAIEKEIYYIQLEKIPPHRDTSAGRVSWKYDQQKRITELKNKL